MKRIIAAILSLVTMLSFIPAEAAANDDYSGYEKESNTLTALSIIDTNLSNENYNELISKAEFVKMAVSFMCEDTSPYMTQKQKFSDVAPDNIYFGYIAYAVLNNLIPSTESFYPEKYIEYDEAEEILVRMAGYGELVQNNAFTQKAAELKIISNVNRRYGVRRCDAVRMLYNCLDVDFPEKDTSDSKHYYYTYDKKAIDFYRRIRYDRGIVDETYLCAINGNNGTKLAKNQIVINKEQYKCDYKAAEDILGCNVEFYYKEENYENKIYYIDTYKNNSVNINSKEFADYENNRFSYYDGNKTKYLKISGTADVIYNWGLCSDFTKEDILLTGLSGNDTFIDNDNDGIYDVIIINDYKDYAPYSIDTVNGILYSKEPSAVVEVSKCNNIAFIDKERGEIDIQRFPTDGVMTVQKSKAENPYDVNYKIFSSTDTVIGRVTYWNPDDRTINIDGQEYYVNSNVSTQIENGMQAKFYIDYFGEVAYVSYDNENTGLKYGYLLSIFQNEGQDTVEARIVNTDGKTEQYQLEDKINFDGTSQKVESVLKSLTDGGSVAYTKRQIIKFELTVSAKVKKIDTKAHGAKELDKSELKVYSYTNAKWICEDDTMNNCINQEYCFDPEAIMFVIPNKAETEKIDQADCRVITFKDYYISKYQNVTMDVADPDDAGISKIGVYYCPYWEDINIGGNEEFNIYNNYSGCYMVDKLIEEVNEDDEVVTMLYYYDDGKIKSAEVIDKNIVKKPIYNDDGEETGEYKNLVQGDIIQMHKDDRGKITAIHINHDYERVDNKRFISKVHEENENNGWYDGEFGMVYSKSGNGISMVVKVRNDAQLYNPNEPDKTFDIVEAPRDDIWKPFDFENPDDLARLQSMTVHSWSFTNTIIVYDSKEEKIRVGTYSDIIDYKSAKVNPSLVYIRVYQPKFKQIFLYK